MGSMISKCWWPIGAKSRFGRSARSTNSASARWPSMPTRTAIRSIGSRPTSRARSARWVTRCGRICPSAKPSKRHSGRPPTPSTPVMGFCRRTRTWPRRPRGRHRSVSEGDQVSAGQTVATIEAMKMEAPITAPRDATGQRVAVSSTVQVEGGDLLAVLS
jgi:Biotin-requiring enzyme